MGVFDGGTYEVSVRYKDDSEQDFYESDPAGLVEELRTNPKVKAVMTCWVNYVIGDVVDKYSFGDFWGEEGDE
ncbi:hypothetical protein ABZ353_10965 [Streptomyces niveus]|uniref:hypothetical protein n=1 Tax=Streptomyces niveus TaxID=193462 RepID=UPI0033DDACE7